MTVAVVAIAGVTAGLILLVQESTPPTLPLAAGTSIVMPYASGWYQAIYDFSWDWGAYLKGSWTATANTTALVEPKLNCFSCPFFKAFQVRGTNGTFAYAFGGPGNGYRDMIINFYSAEPDTIRVTQTIQVVYPPLTVILAAGTHLSGTGPQVYPFTVQEPDAYLIGTWSAVNTTLWSYEGTPQEPTNCAGWPVGSPPLSYDGSFGYHLAAGNYSVGVAPCATRPWTVTVTTSIGFFYP